MSQEFVMLGIEKNEATGELNVKLRVNGQQRSYIMKFGYVGYSLSGELENLITTSLDRTRRFTDLVARFDEGDRIVFPIDLSDI